MRKVKAVIFDCGGVLVKKYKDSRTKDRDLAQVLVQAGGAKLKKQAFTGKIKGALVWDSIADSGHFSASRTKDIKDELMNKRPLDKKVFKLGKTIAKSYKTAIVSDGIAEIFWHWVKKFDLKKHFKIMVLSADVQTSKPHEKIFRITLNKLKVRADEAIFIDDRVENVRGARKIGIKSFHYTGRNFSELELWLIKMGVL